MSDCYMVLVNQQAGPALLSSLEALCDGGTRPTLHVVVPVRDATDDVLDFLHAEHLDDGRDPEHALAQWNLDGIIGFLQDHGYEAHGEVGERDPVAAVVRCASSGEPYRGVVVSTARAGLSRFFGHDLPTRIERRSPVPVVNVVVEDRVLGAART